MKYLLILLLLVFSFFCYSQQIQITSSKSRNQKQTNFWIDIKIMNNTQDTLIIPKHPRFGFKEESTIDYFIEFIDPITDTIIDIQAKGDYNYVIPGRNERKILPNKKYEFSYYLDNIYDLDPNREYNICLHLILKSKSQEIISNSLLIPVHSNKR